MPSDVTRLRVVTSTEVKAEVTLMSVGDDTKRLFTFLNLEYSLCRILGNMSPPMFCSRVYHNLFLDKKMSPTLQTSLRN